MFLISYLNPILYIIIASICSAIAIGVGIALLQASKRYNNSLFAYFGLYTIGMAISTVFIIIRLQIPGESENTMFTQNGVVCYMLSGIFTLFANSCLIIGINQLEKTKISTFVVIIISVVIVYFILSFVLYFLLMNEGVYIHNSVGFNYFRIIGEIFSLMFGSIYYFAIFVKLLQKTPKELKKLLTLSFITSILLISIFLLSRIGLFYFSGINEITGLFFTTNFFILLLKKPEITYILPSRLFRLNVIVNNSGMPAYTYDFTPFETQDIIFTGILYSINKICFDVFKQGQLQEIQFKEGFLLLEESKFFSFSLILTQTSYYLKHALHEFALDFETKYKDRINKPIDTVDFKDAELLIKHHFALVPKRE